MSDTDIEVWEDEDAADEAELSLEVRQAEVADEIAQASERMAALAREAAEIGAENVAGETGAALVPTTGTAADAKKNLTVLRAKATRQQQSLQRKHEEMRAAAREMEDLLRRQVSLATAAMAPLQKFMARLEEGIWMVNLYLGRDEEIVVLRTGEPARADEAVVIRQMVLAMDEECAVNPDEGGIDSTNIEEFDAWLLESEAHVTQVIPETKSVVALRPRRESKDYADPWKQKRASEEDEQTYFLIRNGENLYRTMTKFNAGDRLVSTREEFSSFFFEEERGFGRPGQPKHRIPIAPGTLAWERAEEAADERQRHYMRVALILQGLVDRTTAFHPLPEGGISFTDIEHAGRSWRFIEDMEMAIGTGRAPFFEWLAEKNAGLRKGMRIVGSFTRTYQRDEDEWRARIRPRGAEHPPTGELLTIEDENAGGFVVRYQREDPIWTKEWIPSEDRPGWGHYGGQRLAKIRASCVLYASDRFILPFDLVTEEEMREYLGARQDRHAYSHMFPLLKQAIRAKQAERAEEAPFKTMMVGVLARDTGCGAGEAAEAIDSLVDWWKLTNRNHRPLVGKEKDQAKAVRMLVAEHKRRMGDSRRGTKDSVVERVRGQVKMVRRPADLLLIARRRDGRYVAVCAEGKGPFVTMLNFSARGAYKDAQEWRMLRPSTLAALVIAWKSERLDDWDLHAKDEHHLTGPEFEMLTAQVIAVQQGLVAACYAPEKQVFYTWRFEADAIVDEANPLTGEHKPPTVKEQEWKWERYRGKPELRSSSWHSNRPRYTHQRKPWDTRPAQGEERGGLWWDDERVDPEEMKENHYVVVHHDEALDAHVEAEKARYDAIQKKRSEMQQEVRSLIGSIEAGWVKRKEAEEFTRFLEEYLDPELWEGHKKLLPSGTFSYPHQHVSFTRDEPDALGLMVGYAVEQGISLDGLTVWEAAETHFPPIEWVRDRNRGNVFFDLRDHVPEPIDIPADIRGLTFKAPEPDPDEDDED